MKNQFNNPPKEDQDLVESFGDVRISSRDLEQQEKDRFSDLMAQFSTVKVSKSHVLLYKKKTIKFKTFDATIAVNNYMNFIVTRAFFKN